VRGQRKREEKARKGRERKKVKCHKMFGDRKGQEV
jgi:hypothetical protein